MQQVEVTDDTVRVQLENVTPLTRVHVLATRFDPAFAAYRHPGQHSAAGAVSCCTEPRAESQYVAGPQHRRRISLHHRPEVRPKISGQHARAAELAAESLGDSQHGDGPARGRRPAKHFSRQARTERRLRAAGRSCQRRAVARQSRFRRSRFPGRQFGRAKPISCRTKNGVDRIQAGRPGAASGIVVRGRRSAEHGQPDRGVAGGQVGVSRSAIGQGARSEAALHAAEADHASCRPKGTLVVPDITSTHFEAYDSIARVFTLYAALNNDPKLVEFNFIRNWPSLKHEEKRALYLQIRQPRVAFLPLQEGSRVLQDGDPALSGEQEGKAISRSLAVGRRSERVSQAVEFRAAQHLGADSAGPANPRRAGGHGPTRERSVRTAAARSRPIQPLVRNGAQGEFAGDERSVSAYGKSRAEAKTSSSSSMLDRVAKIKHATEASATADRRRSMQCCHGGRRRRRRRQPPARAAAKCPAAA